MLYKSQEDHKADFDDFDLSKDGLLDAMEIRSRYLSSHEDGISDIDLADFFSVADEDLSGTVTFAEYMKYAKMHDDEM